MGKESVSEVMENHTKENIFKIKNTDMEFLRELMVILIILEDQ